MITNKIPATLITAVVMAVWLSTPGALAKEKSISIQMESGNALVTLLDGQAWVLKYKETQERPLSSGQFLHTGDSVRTGESSRIEVRLPDGSYLRFDEQTDFKLVSTEYRKQEKKRDVRVRVFFGKTWARVSRLFRGKGRFAIQTRTAVAGARGTIYRMNVNRDNSAQVKVYDGEVEVSSRKKDTPPETPGMLSKPVPIKGPHPVTMEEWTYIVRSLQQIDIKPDGTATRPFRFDIKADLNDWVRWNQMRDRAVEQEQ
jgi:hypothetical protein